MEFIKTVNNRRSIRKFKNQKVEQEKIEYMLDCAIQGETWKNSQTGRYYVVQNKSQEFIEQCLPGRNAINCENVSTLIVATFKKNISGFDDENTPTNELGNLWGAYDLGLCNQNLILAATDQGLGTLVMGIRDSQKIKQLLSIPDDEIIVSVIAVGYQDIDPTMPKRKSRDEVVKYY